MATFVIRNMPDHVKTAVKNRAHANKRSMEAELRATITESYAPEKSWVTMWIEGAEELRRQYGGFELELPERSLPRDVEPFA